MVSELSRTIDAKQLGAFRRAFSGDIVLPEDDRYDAARIVWNGMIDRRPAIVVRPANARDVISAVGFAREANLAVAVRGGGHSIPGLGTCDGGIVIDLSRMRGATVDPERRTARVNGGALLAELDGAAQAFGLACPVGVVSHTGVAGLTLGGGMGRLMRKFGLTIDNLLSVELVTADGRVVRASDDENSELFWGMRGAGANFGIVTTFEFRLHPVGPTVTHGSVVHPIDRMADVAARFREFVESSPDDVMTAFVIARAVPEDGYPPEVAGRPIAIIGAHHCGSAASAERDLAPIRSFGPPVVDSFRTKTYLEAQTAGDEDSRWGRRFYMKSGFVTALPDELLERVAEQVEHAPGECGFYAWSCGRAIARVPDDATAYTGRAAAFWVSVESIWEDPARDADFVSWTRRAMGAVEPFTIVGRYVNDVSEVGSDAVVRSVYGNPKYERLVALKRAWDPANVFRLNQNIRP